MAKRFNPNLITDDELLNELRRVKQIIGRTPSKKDLCEHGKYSLYCYRKRFGSMRAACEAAGIDANLGGAELKYSSQELTDEFWRLKNELGHTPSQTEITAKGKYPIGAYKRHFDTYNKFLDSVGVKRNQDNDITAEEIKQDIIRVSQKLGRPPKSAEFKKYSKTVTWLTACHKITNTSSWNTTLKACGLPILHHKNVTKAELKAEFMRLKNHLGRTPSYNDMGHLGKYSVPTYKAAYGSYKKAVESFGFKYIPSPNQYFNQTYTTGRDGVMYRSKFEARIADILHAYLDDGLIDHYEYEKVVCADRSWTCDFYVEIDGRAIWLEADGMGDHRKNPYLESNDKIKYYKAKKLNYKIIKFKKSGLPERISGLLGISK